MTSEDTPNATSSLAPDCGASPLASPDGQTADLFGPLAAPVSRSRSPARGSEPMIQGICGRTYIESSVPPAQQDNQFLFLWESKLRARLGTIGSTESALIWREKKSPLGQSISRLARSMRHTNGTGSGGALWPTPKSSAAGPDFAKLDRSDTGPSRQTVMAGTSYWPTPKASAAGESSRSGDRKDEPLMGGLMRMAHWSTPRASDGEKGAPLQVFSGGGQPLPAQQYANAALWATPLASDVRKHSENPETVKRRIGKGQQIALNAHLALNYATARSGQTQPGSSATTGKRGAPNPGFPCWLMGWSDELVSGALRAIQSYRSSRPKSSRRSSTRNTP